MLLTISKTCRVGEASFAFSFKILILSSRTLRVRVSMLADYGGVLVRRWRLSLRVQAVVLETFTACAECM